MPKFGTRKYGTFHYGFESLFSHVQLADSFSITDGVVTFNGDKIAVEAVAISDVLTKDGTKKLNDFVSILETALSKEVTNKVLAEAVDLDLWLTIDRNDNNSKFTEQ